MSRQQKMVVLKPFPFHGVTLNIDDEFEPETKEQGALLETIGLAAKKRGYRNRMSVPERTTVMTTDTQRNSDA
jgi:hypothetical protein